MYATYNLMLAYTNKRYLEESVDELVKKYRQSNIIVEKNKLFAAIFCNLFPMMIKIQKKYYSLTNEQKVDIATYHLFYSLNRYASKNVKFSTFFHIHLTNKMKSALTLENNLKRAVFQNLVKNNEDMIRWYISTTAYEDKAFEQKQFLDNLNMSEFLNEEEKQICRCVLEGYTSRKDILQRVDFLNNTVPCTNPLVMNRNYEVLNLEEKRREALNKLKYNKIKKEIKQKYKLFSTIKNKILKNKEVNEGELQYFNSGSTIFS